MQWFKTPKVTMSPFKTASEVACMNMKHSGGCSHKTWSPCSSEPNETRTKW